MGLMWTSRNRWRALFLFGRLTLRMLCVWRKSGLFWVARATVSRCAKWFRCTTKNKFGCAPFLRGAFFSMEHGELIPHLFRIEYRKIVSVLSKRFGFDQI